MIKGNIMESTFVSCFCNCKDGTCCINRHEDTSAHKATVDVTINMPGTSRGVGDVLSSAHAKDSS